VCGGGCRLSGAVVAAWLQVDLALAEVERVQQEGPSAEDCATLLELERRAYELSLQVGTHQALSNGWEWLHLHWLDQAC
jgi:hypothetical protein